MNFITRISIICLFLAVTIAYSLWQDKSLKSSLKVEKTNTYLKKLPNVAFKSFNDQSDFFIHKEGSDNQLNVVHFWGTWCAPCASEFPEMIRFIQQFKGKKVGFFLVAVNDKITDVQKFLKTFKSFEKSFTTLIDNESIHSQKYGTVRVPETYIFDSKGNVLKRFSGPQDWMRPHFKKFVLDSLPQASTDT